MDHSNSVLKEPNEDKCKSMIGFDTVIKMMKYIIYYITTDAAIGNNNTATIHLFLSLEVILWNLLIACIFLNKVKCVRCRVLRNSLTLYNLPLKISWFT